MPKLTDLFIEKLPLSPARTTHWDTLLPAFGVRVGARTKTFVVIDSSGSRRKLGHYPAIRLAEARAKAREHMSAPHRPPVLNVQDAATAYLDAIEVRPNTHRSYKLFLTKLQAKYANCNLADLAPRQCAEIIESPHMHLALKIFFNWCKGQALITTSPMDNLKAIGKFKQRSRTLTDDELKRVWIASEQLGTFACIVRLCILTAQRRGEIAQIKSEWLRNDILVIPANVAKNGREHQLPITSEAGTLVKSLIENKTGTYSAWSKPKVKLDNLSNVSEWTIHDLRRTSATNLAKLGTDPFLIERILNHSMPKLQQIYNRHDFTEAMRVPLQKHEDWLLQMVNS
jgi:integrase